MKRRESDRRSYDLPAMLFILFLNFIPVRDSSDRSSYRFVLYNRAVLFGMGGWFVGKSCVVGVV